MTERQSFIVDNNLIYAGGVIFYRIRNDNMELLLLKSKSRQKYEEFGGTIDKYDKDIYETVCREVEEESNNVIKRNEIINDVVTSEYVCSQKSKYIVFIVKAIDRICNLESTIFGEKEIHDNIERTVKWITLKDFYNFVKSKEINFRLVNKTLFDKLDKLAIENGIKYHDNNVDISNNNDNDNDNNDNNSITNKIDRKVYLF